MSSLSLAFGHASCLQIGQVNVPVFIQSSQSLSQLRVRVARTRRSWLHTPIAHANLSDVQGTPTEDRHKDLSLTRIARSLWSFSRPHTVYGTILSVLSVTLVASREYGIPSSTLIFPLLVSLIPALLLNVYIVGLNQLYDIQIDRINKPYLPLASEAMTIRDAYTVILSALILGLSFCIMPGATSALRIVLIGSAILGTAYSVPPLRLKRYALLASIAILTVRGLLVNIGFFLHAAASRLSVLHRSPSLPPVIAFAALFFTAFGVVIALLKDVPDIKGDRMFNIRTFSVRVGAAVIFRICVATLVTMFFSAGFFYFSIGRSMLGRVTSFAVHAAMAIFLSYRARRVDLSNAANVTDFYMLSWKAFYTEYLFLPLASL